MSYVLVWLGSVIDCDLINGIGEIVNVSLG